MDKGEVIKKTNIEKTHVPDKVYAFMIQSHHMLYELLNCKDGDSVSVEVFDDQCRIPVRQILYISVAKRGSTVHQYCNSADKEISCRETVKELYKQLTGMGFEYAHNRQF